MTAPNCRCGATWTGMRMEHCPECHQTFTGTIAGDKHRTGKHHLSTGPDRRRCMTVEEMTDKGMTQNARGVWGSGGKSPWAHDCATCQDCIHDPSGVGCCGCYDGACCKAGAA